MISPYTCQNGSHQKNQQTTSDGEDVEKREPLYTIGGTVNWDSHCKTQYADSSEN